MASVQTEVKPKRISPTKAGSHGEPYDEAPPPPHVQQKRAEAHGADQASVNKAYSDIKMNPQLLQDHHWEGKTLIEQDIKDNWSQSWKLPDHPSHKAWGDSLNTGYKADGQVDIEAWRKLVDGGGTDPQLAEQLGVEPFTDSQKKRMRSSYSQGAIPGYETDMASYGFDYEEYTKAMEDQEREKTWLEIVLKNPSHPALIQIFGSQAAVDQMIRETQKSIASRDAYYRDNWANWKASLAAEQEADLARWAELEEAYHYIEQGDFEDGQALLKYIGAQMDLLAYNINGRSHAIVQTAEDFAQFSGAAADYGSDWVYAAVNQNSGYFDDLTIQFHTPELSKYAFLTDEEQATYNYYYHFDQQMGTRCAAAYLSYIDNRLTYREAMYAAEDAERFGQQHPVAGTLASSLFTLVEGGGALLTGWNALMGSDYTNPYSRAYAPHIMKESLREGVTEDFSPTGKALYGIGTGLMDQGVAMLTGNAPMVMGLTDATGQSFDAGTQGGGTYEMAGEGLGAYAIGALTEKLDVGRFTRMLNLGKAGKGSFKELLTTFVKNGLSGGLEEIPEAYLTAALDRYIMAESSRWETRKKALEAQGLSPEEAEKQLWNELNYDAMINGVTGFLTSGTLSGVGYGAGKASVRKTVAALASDDPKIKGSGILAKYQRDIISFDNLNAAYHEAEAAGSTPEQLARIDEKIQKQEAALETLESSTELTRVLEADGLGAVRNGEGEMAEESDVSPEIARQMAENQEQDQAEFARYQEILGAENMPKDLAEFQLMKYTESEKWKTLQWDYSFENQYRATSHRPALINGNMPRGINDKLLGYSLNPEHTIGKHKAIVFQKALGYTMENVQELEAKIRKGIVDYRCIPKGNKGYGDTFDVIVLVRGPKGVQPVVTGWIYDPGQNTPRMVTAYVSDKIRRP